MSSRLRALRALFLALFTFLCTASAASAANLVVNTTADNTATGTECSGAPSDCSLRQAIDKANTLGGANTISFSVPAGSTISLTHGALSPAGSGSLTISGPGANKLTIARASSAAASPVFNVSVASGTFSGFTVTGGAGGAFEAAGANFGGGTMTLNGLVVTGNTANAGGGGAASAIVTGFLGSETLTIENSAITNNSLSNAGGNGSSTVVNFGTLTVANTTVSGNTVAGAGSTADAAGIGNFGGEAVLVNSTISGNTSQNGTGGVTGSGPTYVANTIIAGNTGGSSPDCSGSLTSRGYNLIGNDSGCKVSSSTGDQLGTSAAPINPHLGPLADNGGSTPTMALLDGSSAINAGNPASPSDAAPAAPPALVPCRTTDQRGVRRPQGSRCDIGAYEATPPTAATGAASAVKHSSATLGGTVNPQNLTTTYHFDYGTTSAYGSSTTVHAAGSGATSQTETVPITSLKANTTYHFRIVASNAVGTTYGADRVFTTSASRLKLKASPRSVKAGQRVCVRFTVTASGKAVHGATVRFAHHKKKTSRQGKAVICATLKEGSYQAVASASGLRAARARVKVLATHPERPGPEPPNDKAPLQAR